jgi:hypothetical protein
MGRCTTASEESHPVRLVLDLPAGVRLRDRGVNGPEGLLVRAPGAASGEERACSGLESRLEEELREGRVGLIGPAAVQANLEKARHLDLAPASAVIDERQRAYLGVRIRRDTDRAAGLDVAVPPMELGAVGSRIESGCVRGLSRRLDAHRPGPADARIANVMDVAPAVARDVFAPARHIKASPRAVAPPASVIITAYEPFESSARVRGCLIGPWIPLRQRVSPRRGGEARSERRGPPHLTRRSVPG